MSTYRVPKCGRHFVKFDDVTIYPVLVVARTDKEFLRFGALILRLPAAKTEKTALKKVIQVIFLRRARRTLVRRRLKQQNQ